MRGLALVILLTACRGGGDDDFPIHPNGDDTTIFPQPDAPIVLDAPDGGGTIAGRVCLLSDARALLSTSQISCAATGVGGLMVTLGTENAVTADDGTFSIITPMETDLVWHVSGTGIVKSVMPLTATPLIPALTVDTYSALLLDNVGNLLAADEGSIFARVVTSAGPLAGATATSDPPPQFGTLYDTANAAVWGGAQTGAFGVAWLPGITAGETTVTVTPPLGDKVEVSAPVEQEAITFVTVAIP